MAYRYRVPPNSENVRQMLGMGTKIYYFEFFNNTFRQALYKQKACIIKYLQSNNPYRERLGRQAC